MFDYGATNLALSAVTVFAATIMKRRIVGLTLIAFLLHAVPHLLFHITHQHHHSVSDKVGETTALALCILVPALLLILTGQPRATRSSPHQ